ncbi:MAG: SDR family oxidoreductase [Lapillicoccus sp.]
MTGAAQGIGRALVDALIHERVASIVAVDLDIGALDGTSETSDTSANRTTLLAEQSDVTRPGELDRIVALAEREFGRVDIFCSNAGVMSLGGVEASDEAWQASWEVNVMAHVRAARAVVPGMLSRSSGVLLNVVSAAALLSAPESAPYTATKHAALGFSEWLAITYGHRGIQVCVVCPEAVDTRMRRDARSQRTARGHRLTEGGAVLSPQAVATAAVASVKAGQFLSTPHPHTLRRAQQKWSDVDAWITAMNSSVRGNG